MPFKDPRSAAAKPSNRDCQTRWLAKNSDYHKIWSQKHSKLIKALCHSRKDVPCADCKQRYPPCVMDFDHVRGRKRFGLAAYSSSWSKEIWEKEMAKCEVVCANCHRLRTFDRRSRGAIFSA